MSRISRSFGVLGFAALLVGGLAGQAWAANTSSAGESLAVEFQGPRKLSEAERRAVLPSTAAQPDGKSAAPASYPDLSGFTLTVKPERKSAESAENPARIGSSEASLSGSVSSTFDRYTGSVAAGDSVRFIVAGIVTVAALRTVSGDADVYVEGCDGTPVGKSTRGGLSLDTIDIYSLIGAPTCRVVRIYGYGASSFELAIHNYN